jgi:GMP synthase (glutamine-hydrolysing)
MKQKHIAILDFGSQYMHLISRRIRQLGVKSVIYPTNVNAHDLKDAVGIIISGGPQSVNEQKLPYDPGIFDLPVPILGLCYGHQLMAFHYGGKVTAQHNREYGKAQLQVKGQSPLLADLADAEQVWMSHWDSVTEVPEGFQVVGSTRDCPVAAMANDQTQRYGLQFHPEVHHSTNGLTVLRNFVFKVCGAEVNWSMEEYIAELEEEVRQTVGDRKVFLLVSGGVDSAVAFALLEKVLGKRRVYGLHIDNGFMRLHESQLIGEALTEAGFEDLHVLDASDRFLLATERLTDPEEKRRMIGKVFLDAQRDLFADLGFNPDEWVLGQGTIYPDTIESGGTQAADLIKTHHNRVEEIVQMINEGRVVEPLAELYKDEVRALGLKLGLPGPILHRWPFPGPGLAIRTLCSDGKPDELPNLAEVNDLITTLAADVGLRGVVLPVKSVGVQGDQRSFQHPAMLFGKADVSWELLGDLAVHITNTVHGVNRVVRHVGGESDPAKMTLKPAYLTRDRLDLLRQADAIVDEEVRGYGMYDEIWQFPVVLLPVSFGQGESVVLRPIESQEAMTVNFYPLAKPVLDRIIRRLLELEGIDAVLYDITNKPPATIEWE